jgi:hypothetical protein
MNRRYRRTDPSVETVELVIERDLAGCVVCGRLLRGDRGSDWSVQHRVRRGGGGTRRPWMNLPGNLALICGSGTTRCHGEVEDNPTWAEEYGWRVKDGITLPSQVPLFHAPRELWLYLADDGSVSPEYPESAA